MFYLIVIAGFLAGLLAGTFGVGGGAITIPFLIFMLKLPLPIAIGTNLLIVSFNSFIAMLVHASQKTTNWKGTLMGISGALTTVIGNFIFIRLANAGLLKYVVGSVFVILSFLLWFKVDGYREPTLKMLIITGALMGIYSALVGKGGASLAIPLLIALFNVRTKDAIKATVTATPIVAGTAALEKLLYGFCSVSVALSFIPFMVLGSFLGAKIMKRSPSNTLKMAYSAFLFFIGISIILF